MGKQDTTQNADIVNLQKWIAYLKQQQDTIIKNQNVLIANNEAFIKNDNYFLQSIETLNKTNEKQDVADEQFRTLLKTLSEVKPQPETSP